MGFYGYAAFLCWIALHPHPTKMFFLSGLIVYSVYAIYLFFDKTGVLNWATAHGAENIAQSMKATKPWIEETREFFGLVIVIVVVVINLVQISKKEKIAKAGISD